LAAAAAHDLLGYILQNWVVALVNACEWVEMAVAALVQKLGAMLAPLLILLFLPLEEVASIVLLILAGYDVVGSSGLVLLSSVVVVDLCLKNLISFLLLLLHALILIDFAFKPLLTHVGVVILLLSEGLLPGFLVCNSKVFVEAITLYRSVNTKLKRLPEMKWFEDGSGWRKAAESTYW